MVTIISGSARNNSNTLKVAKAIKKSIFQEDNNLEVKIIDFFGFDIPSVNKGSLHIDTLTEWQSELYESMKNSSLIFILTPEYNWFPSAEVIQMIHSLAATQFAAAWKDKVFVTCGVSNGRGGRMPAVQLSYAINKIINVFDFESIVSAKMFESQFTPHVLNSEGESLGNPEFDKGLKAFVSYNLKLDKRLSK